MGGQGGGMAPQATVTQGGYQPQQSWLWAGGGGMVPGPLGVPRKAIVHGGELIIPPEGLYGLLKQLGRGNDLDTRGMK